MHAPGLRAWQGSNLRPSACKAANLGYRARSHVVVIEKLRVPAASE